MDFTGRMNISLYPEHKQFLKSCEETFISSYGNYHCSIEVNDRKLKYFKKDEMPKGVFSLANKLKSELNKKRDKIESLCHWVREGHVKYFRVGNNIKKSDFTLVDINSAYAQTLINFDLISNDTAKKLLNCDKEYRLPAIGIMAAKKYYEFYENGKMKDFDSEIKDELLRKLFFRICMEVACCMDFMANELKNDFLFFWVDGIVVRNYEKHAQTISDIMQNFNYQYKIESVKANKIAMNKNIFHIKMQGEKGEKEFQIPVEFSAKKEFDISDRLNEVVNTIVEKQNTQLGTQLAIFEA